MHTSPNVPEAYIGKFANHCPYPKSIAIESDTFNTICKKHNPINYI
jgi:hypothetical protein